MHFTCFYSNILYGIRGDRVTRVYYIVSYCVRFSLISYAERQKRMRRSPITAARRTERQAAAASCMGTVRRGVAVVARRGVVLFGVVRFGGGGVRES